jgi:hypothetical protein
MRKALFSALLAVAASPGCMCVSLRFDHPSLPITFPPNTPGTSTFSSPPPDAPAADEAPAEAAPGQAAPAQPPPVQSPPAQSQPAGQ